MIGEVARLIVAPNQAELSKRLWQKLLNCLSAPKAARTCGSNGDAEHICTHPEHPYTRALLSAVPVPDPRLRDAKRRFRYEEAEDKLAF